MSYHSKSTKDKQCFSGDSPEIGKGLLDELERLRHYIANLERRQDEHGELEEKLRRSEELYRSLVESSQDLIFQCDRNGRLTFVNKAWEHTLGYGVKEILQRRIADLQAPNVAQRDGRAFSQLPLNGSIIGYETALISMTGKPVRLSFNVVAIRDSAGQLSGIQGTAYNISGTRKLEEERLQMQKLESIGTLAGGIAHDFNNLLQAILGNIQLAKRVLDPGGRPFSWLSAAEKAGDQAKDLSYRLLTFAKGGEPFKRVTSITNLLREAVQLALSGSNISAEFILEDNPYDLEIDEGQMKQALSNIVINSKDVMTRGGHITISTRNISAHEDNNLPLRGRNYVHIAIEDHGVGIAPKNLPRIFDPYFTTKGMGSEKGKGLGLTICHSIITRHDGLISVDSTPGVKTTVNIYLPEAEKACRPTQDIPAALEPRKERILLMDDEDFVRDVTGDMLMQLGYEVQLAKDGDEAIETYTRALKEGMLFDAVILDLTIPGGTGGDEAILKLLEIDPNVRGILSSGYADNNVMNDFREFGFKGVIAKPFKFDALASIIANVIGRSP